MKSFKITILSLATLVLLASASSTFAADKNNNHNTVQKQQSSQKAPAQTSNKSKPKVVRHPTVGSKTKILPKSQQAIRFNRDNYHYNNGTFYRPQPNGNYLVVRPPVGIHVNHIPSGHISFHIGLTRYFYTNNAYYRWDPVRTVYIVVEKPVGAYTAVIEANEYVGSEIFAYPNNGQSQAKQDSDRYECYLWAVEQTGFDPATLDQDSDNASYYRRAVTACLVSREYTVR